MNDRPGGMLVVVATPIGNLEDITLRALRVLGEVDALACEDTRRTRRIYERYNLPRPGLIFSYHEHNEDRAAERIVELLNQGRTVALCSNAGYPGVSDPGYKVIVRAIAGGHRVEVLPGPGAVETALIVSGLPSNSYTFLGFPPRKSSARRRLLERERETRHTLVLFESPHRLGQLLADALVALGDRRAVVCIELTKLFEEVDRGYLSDLAERYAGRVVKGEVTVVIAGNNPKFVRPSSNAS
ncbi:MAG: 16S rRNA (cytidine(1402)-2'-O)-methyltransferase [Candidatus Zipacnadales bacterium]